MLFSYSIQNGQYQGFCLVKCYNKVWKFEWSVIILKPLHIEMHVHTSNLNTAHAHLYLVEYKIQMLAFLYVLIPCGRGSTFAMGVS
jgi:hypothetical protein